MTQLNSNSTEDSNDSKSDLAEEDDIFKTLNHKVRREIIKTIGRQTHLAFSEIKKQIDPIESPALSYHLKNLQPFVLQESNKYILSEIGEAALNLLEKSDQSHRIMKYRQKFTSAYIVTVICWISAATIIPLIYYSSINPDLKLGAIQIIITVISWMNFVIVWRLKQKY